VVWARGGMGMNDLDKKLDNKLHDIITRAQSYIDDEDIKKQAANTALHEIKQAFKDAGWLSSEDFRKIHGAVHSGMENTNRMLEGFVKFARKK
jgi:hypothetical protein